MAKKQHYMTYSERLKLEVLYNNVKLPVSEIASILGFCRQTIYTELKIGKYLHTCDYKDEVRYSADKAEQLHRFAQSGKGRAEKIGNDLSFSNFIEDKIVKDKYSPAAALAEARSAGFRTQVCVSTLYSYIDKGMFLTLSNKHLLYKGRNKRSEKHEQRVTHPLLPSISERPEKINERSELGHWESDLIVGVKGSAPVLLTLTERVMRHERIFRLPDRRALTIRSVFDKLESSDPQFHDHFKSITTDNGSEFLQYEQLRTSVNGGNRFDVYYCHPFSAWEKGSNENCNRIIRRFFPKGTDFGNVTDEEVQTVEDWINNYPRKILDWKTPNQLMEELHF